MVKVREHLLVSAESHFSLLNFVEGDAANVLDAFWVFIMRTSSLSFWLQVHHCLFVEHLDSLVQFRIFLLNFFSVCIDFLELFWELCKALEELLDDDDAKHKALSFSSEGLDDEFERYALQDIVEEAIFDNSSKQLCNFCQVDMRIFVQKAVLVEEAVKHACIYFLLFDYLGLLEGLQRHNQLLDPFIDLVRLSGENVLEIFIGCPINFFRALSRTHLPREEDSILRD